MQDCHAQMSADVARKAYTHAFGWRAGIIVVKVLWLMVTEGVAEMLAPITLFHFDLAAVGAIPVMVFAYHCHVQSVPIYYELSFDPALFDCVKLRRAALERRQQAMQQQQHQTEAPTDQVVSASAAAVAADVDVTTDSAPLLPLVNGSISTPPADGAAAAAAAAAVGVAPQRTAGEVRRKLFGMARVLAAAYAECTILYLSTGIAGLILFPQHVESNILKNFPPDDVLMQVLQLHAVLVSTFLYGIGFWPTCLTTLLLPTVVSCCSFPWITCVPCTTSSVNLNGQHPSLGSHGAADYAIPGRVCGAAALPDQPTRGALRAVRSPLSLLRRGTTGACALQPRGRPHCRVLCGVSGHRVCRQRPGHRVSGNWGPRGVPPGVRTAWGAGGGALPWKVSRRPLGHCGAIARAIARGHLWVWVWVHRTHA